MSRTRLAFCWGVIAVLVLGSLYDIIRFREHYPFSHYYMFSTIQSDMIVRQYKAVGYPSNGGPPFIINSPLQMEPWLPQRFSLALEAFEGDPGFPGIARDAALDLLSRYNDTRRRGRHQGPEITALAVAKVSWRVLPDVSNKHSPDRLEEIARVSNEGIK